MKGCLLVIGVLLLILGATIFGVFKWYNDNLLPVSSSTDIVTFSVEPGTPTPVILQELFEEGLIKDATAAQIFMRLQSEPIIIQAGDFRVSPNLGTEELLNSLNNPEETNIWVTVQEGLRYDEVAAIWGSQDLEFFDEQEFILLIQKQFQGHPNAEGYLYPDTYNVDIEATTEDIFELMTTTFFDKVGFITYDQLILASIVEREASTDDEKPTIAGILQKRLDTPGWRLQADATILYFLMDWKATITPEDIDEANQYNTYYVDGLPPTPISNPGLSSIEAVKFPKDGTPYWYYLHDNTGEVHYATTIDEHNANIYEYLY